MQLTVQIWMINENWKDFIFYLSWGRFFQKISLWAMERLIWDSFLRMKSLHKLSHWFYLGHASYLCHLGAPCGKQKIQNWSILNELIHFSTRSEEQHQKIKSTLRKVTWLHWSGWALFQLLHTRILLPIPSNLIFRRLRNLK